MFRELLSYCVTSIEASGSFSLRLAVLSNETRLFINFWAGNSLHSLCIAVFPGRMTNSTALINPVSSLLALLDKDVQILFMSGFTRRFVWATSLVLPQRRRICATPRFDADDLESVLLVPSVQLLDRFDFRSVLDFLLMRLRSACGSSWLSVLPDFQRVMFCFFSLFFVIIKR